MGILDDLAMGFGLKERTQDYDARTARTIAANKAAESGSGSSDAMRLAQARNPSHRTFFGFNQPAMQSATNYLEGIQPGYRPQIAQDDRPFMQRALFSPQGTPSPRPYAIGPLTLQGPLKLPGVLGMITGGLFGQQNREIPTVSANGGPMRVRPSGYQPPLSTTPFEIGNSGAGMDYVTPAYTQNYQAPYEIGNSGLGMDYVTPTQLTSVLDADPESLIPTPPSEEGLPELLLPRVDDPTYEEFMNHQKELEKKMGYDSLSETQYRTMYNRLVTR
jgi:hypothetical protein